LQARKALGAVSAHASPALHVIAGLNPAIHEKAEILALDGRSAPAHDQFPTKPFLLKPDDALVFACARI
jgi:hypothetical protein